MNRPDATKWLVLHVGGYTIVQSEHASEAAALRSARGYDANRPGHHLQVVETRVVRDSVEQPFKRNATRSAGR